MALAVGLMPYARFFKVSAAALYFDLRLPPPYFIVILLQHSPAPGKKQS
jgi:hypothetical protein